jgi:prevent-host-death family protein
MKSVGTLEAKIHLTRILDEVARGSEYVVTKRGKPVARIVPAGPVTKKMEKARLVERMLALRNAVRARLSTKQIRELIAEGRR